MSETPKKPRAKKKAAPQGGRPSRAPQKRDDAALKEAVLLAALPHAAFDGFTDSVLQKAGAEAGVEQGRPGAAVRGRPRQPGRIFFRTGPMPGWRRGWRRWT